VLGIDPKAARTAWTVFLVALLVAAAYAVRETLAVFVIALLFAYLLAPLVGFIERVTPHQVSPRIALAIVYLAFVGVIVSLAMTLGSRLADDANSLALQLPALVKNPEWMQRVPLPSWLEPARAGLVQKVQEQLSSGGQQILPYIKGLGGQLVSGAKYALYLVLVPILAFFFLKDGAAIRDEFVSALVE
jgi:putative permease